MKIPKRPFKIFYYLIVVFIGLAALLLVFSTLPVTGNYKVMIVSSGSMRPDITMGSIVIVKPADNYKIGEVVTFQTGEDRDPITHRINEIRVVGGEPQYITKGDANNAPDLGEISEEDIVGKVVFDIPFLGYIVNFIQKPIGFSLVVLVPAFVIIGDEIKKIYEEVKKKKKR